MSALRMIGTLVAGSAAIVFLLALAGAFLTGLVLGTAWLAGTASGVVVHTFCRVSGVC